MTENQYFVTIGKGKAGDYVLAKNEEEAKKRFLHWVKLTMRVNKL